MAIELRPKTKKLNYNKSGAAKARKEAKRKDAEARQMEHSKLTNGQRLAKLDQYGFAAKKERAKIMQRIAEGKV